MQRRDQSRFHGLLILTLGALFACGGGGGGGGGGGSGGGAVHVESEGNNTAAEADAIAIGANASGSLDAVGDVDYWSVALTAGQFISIELLATRLDQTHWDDNQGKNSPRLTLYDVDGTTKLLEHDYSGATSGGWDWGRHDLDIPLYRVATTGPHFVAVRQDNPALDGGDYVLRVRTQTLTGVQTELEPSASSGGNDTPGTSEPIVAGNVRGYHVDGEVDVYSFTVAAPSFVRFELTAYRNGVFHGDDDYFDARLRLLDADGTTSLETSQDAFFSDPALHFRIDTPGTYFVQVEQQSGSGDGEYFLAFSSSSAAGLASEIETNDAPLAAQPVAYGTILEGNATTSDDDFYSFTGNAGDLLRVQTFHADNWREAADTVTVEALDSDGTSPLLVDPEGNLHTQSVLLRHGGTFYLRVPAAASATAYAFRLERVCASLWETEDNDSIANADLLDAGGRASGVVIDVNDDDFFRFSATRDVPVTIQIYAAKSLHSDGFLEYSGHGSALPSRVRLFDAGGGLVGESHYGKVIGTEGVIFGLPTGAACFVPATTGTYYARVEAVNNLGQSDYHYVIEKR